MKRAAVWAVAMGAAFVASGEAELTKYLVMDERIIQEAEGARLVLGEVHKHAANPLFREDRPWEVRFDNLYANVRYDAEQGLYTCWYSPFIVDERTSSTPPERRASVKYIEAQPTGREMGVCYATSKDGLAWEKPALGLTPFGANAQNNIVARGPHGAGVFKDEREPDATKRYKMIYRGEQDMAVAVSPDGLRWGPSVVCAEIQAAGDTHNNALWVPEREEYVAFTRLWDASKGVRQVGWSHSKEFEHWSRAEVVLEGESPQAQVYAMPVFRHAGVYLGLSAVFDTAADRVHTELAWSADTQHWKRVCAGQALIPNGEHQGDYDWGCVYAAAYPICLNDEIRLYYGGSDGPHTGWRKGSLCLATLRPDGFAGYAPVDPAAPGEITTVPFSAPGEIQVSADVDAGGSLETSLIDESGAVIASAAPVKASVTSLRLDWGANDIGQHATARLRFALRKATLYAFELAGAPIVKGEQR